MAWNADGLLRCATFAAAALVVRAGLRRISDRKRRRQARREGLPWAPILSREEVERFLRDGVLVVPGVLSAEELRAAVAGLRSTLERHAGFDFDRLEETAGGLRALSSTGGSGGVLDLFYAPWKLQVQTNERLFRIMAELWQATYAGGHTAGTWRHPHGPFPAGEGYVYVDRICVRVPDRVSRAHAAAEGPKAARRWGLQRPLHPHLDCCPARLHAPPPKHVDANTPRKWRPIQSFVALTDGRRRHRGGFEAARGFHRRFDAWAEQRSAAAEGAGGAAPPCFGDFTPVVPGNAADQAALRAIEHVPCPAGGAVFWDWRLPHASERKHSGEEPRCVVYAGLLPPVPLNRSYAERQRELYRDRKPTSDCWTLPVDGRERDEEDVRWSALGRRLMAMEPWPRAGRPAP